MPESRLTLSKNKLVLEGTPPYRIAPTVVMAEVLLRLPPMSDRDDGKPTIVSILPKLNPIDYRKLMTVIDTDHELRERFSELRQRFCGIAFPGAVSWPVPKPDEILDDLMLSMGPVRGLICTIDGQRLIAVEHQNTPKLLTIEEFRYVFGRDVNDVVRDAAQDSAKSIRQFATLCTSKPVRYAVSLVDNDFQALTKIVTAYSRDQLDRYAKRLYSVITDVTTKEST